MDFEKGLRTAMAKRMGHITEQLDHITVELGRGVKHLGRMSVHLGRMSVQLRHIIRQLDDVLEREAGAASSGEELAGTAGGCSALEDEAALTLLSPLQAACMTLLIDGGMTATQIAEQLRMGRSSASEAAGKLVEKGMARHSDGGRAFELTHDGRRVLAAAVLAGHAPGRGDAAAKPAKPAKPAKRWTRLTHRQAAYMALLLEGSTTVLQMAEEMGVSQSSAWDMASKLVEKGMAQRDNSGRAFELTHDGRATLARHQATRQHSSQWALHGRQQR